MELIVFILYLVFMIGIGVYFFLRTKNGGEKMYFLGGRKMGPWVTALSAGASDMSAWVLMGLPTAVFSLGLGQIWIPIGLLLGYSLSWLLEAPRLRKFSLAANDSITIPQYLTNRFLSKSKSLQVICAAVFLFAYTIYAASSIKACGTLFHTVIGIDANTAMYLAAAIIVAYTFFGGFSAVCWTDFFQGLLMLGALLLAPIFALGALNLTESASAIPADFFNPFSDWKSIVSGLGWGLGYFGMPHIIVRFLSLRSQKEMKKSAFIGIGWTLLILGFATAVGVVGRMMFGASDAIAENSTVFIQMVRQLFPAILSGILLSAVLAASMSTADSQLLSAASALASDVYQPILRKHRASDREMQWVGRLVVLAIAIAALSLAAFPGSGSIMSLVENAWGIFGAAFGPAILLSLFWKRFTFSGAIAGIVTGAAVDLLWLLFCSGTGIYEIIPGFLAGTIAAVLVTLLSKKPSEEIEALFDRAVAYED
ncbi:MAG: sodium/proline symporter [Clostridia bacterium]|nr:sodium/proline symporter [Clostridia bacterium]